MSSRIHGIRILIISSLQVFWMSYKDFLQKFANLQRTRLFGPEWTVAQQWTTLDVPPDCDFLETKFSLHLAEPCRTVIVLSQVGIEYEVQQPYDADNATA